MGCLSSYFSFDPPPTSPLLHCMINLSNANSDQGASLKNNYILIDFENVQPKSLKILNGHPFQVLLFVGSNQTKVPIDLATEMQALGNKASYIQIEGNGRNALDFHIAFYAGQLAEKDLDCYLHIISKDTGFDALVKHLKTKKIHASRVKELADIPILRISSAKSDKEKIDAIVKSLTARGNARPRKVQTLANTINSLFSKSLDEAELSSLIEALKKQKYITVDGNNVSYQAPISGA